MSREDTLRKIHALFAKEHAHGTTPAEVAAALAMATRLLEREGLSRAQLELEGKEPEETAQMFNSPLYGEIRNSKSTWRIHLANALANNFGCFIYVTGGATFIVGRPSDTNTVRYLYSYCEKEIDRIAFIYCKGEGKTYSNNFRIGCGDSINYSIKSERQAERANTKANADSKALVIINNALAKIDAYVEEAKALAYSKLKMQKGKGSNYKGDYGARAYGLEVGRSIYPGQNKSSLGAGQKKLT